MNSLFKKTVVSLLLVLSLCPMASHADDPIRLVQALKILESVPHGKKLILDAKKMWKESTLEGVSNHLKWGEVSRTDAVLTRTLDQSTGSESRVREVVIILKSGQKLSESALDLGHELTHATQGGGWDPYDPELSAGTYIKQALEGRGGEVDALYNECLIAFELYQDHGVRTARCQNYRVDLERDPVVTQIKKDFYKVGKHKNKIMARIDHRDDWDQILTEQRPELYSSTGNAPYPLALLNEFENLTDTACQNSVKRVQSLSRAPASDERQTSEIKRAKKFIGKRCGSGFSIDHK